MRRLVIASTLFVSFASPAYACGLVNSTNAAYWDCIERQQQYETLKRQNETVMQQTNEQRSREKSNAFQDYLNGKNDDFLFKRY